MGPTTDQDIELVPRQERGKTPRDVGTGPRGRKNHMAAARRQPPRQDKYGAKKICTGATRELRTY